MANAYEVPGQQLPFQANADLSSNQFHAVVMNSSKKVAVAGAGVAILGVLQNKPAAANRAATVMVNGVSKGVAGAAIVAGVELEVNASGRFITLASGKAVGMALDAAAADAEMLPVLLYK